MYIKSLNLGNDNISRPIKLILLIPLNARFLQISPAYPLFKPMIDTVLD